MPPREYHYVCFADADSGVTVYLLGPFDHAQDADSAIPAAREWLWTQSPRFWSQRLYRSTAWEGSQVLKEPSVMDVVARDVAKRIRNLVHNTRDLGVTNVT